MLDAKVAQLLNEQVNKEFYSAYLYLDFSIYYEEEGLDGFANWYKIQAQEERDHAMLMVQYLQNNGGKVTLEAIAKPDRELTSRLRVLELGLEHERYVTGSSTATPIPCATATQWQRGRGWLPQAPLWRRSPPISRTGWIMCGCSLSPLI